MELELIQIITEGSYLQLSGLLGLVLFFVLVGLREVRNDRPEGYLYLNVAVFLAIAHAVMLANLVAEGLTGAIISDLTLWAWLVVFFAPALVTMFVVRALFNFAISQGREGMVKLFFGVTLICYLYMLGANWPMDVRAALTLIWLAVFFKTELAITN
jgi:hypothetical protein